MSTFRANNLPISCPPTYAEEKSYTNVYRLINGTHIHEEEFISNLEQNPKRKPKKGQNLCDLNAISFFDNKNAIINIKRNVYNFRNSNIATGHLDIGDGKSTLNNGHINLWIYKNINLYSRFAII